MEILDDYTSTILRNLDEGLAIVDKDLKSVYNNKVLNSILDLADNQEANVFALVSDEDMANIKTLLSQSNDDKVKSDVKITTAQGNQKALRISISPFVDTKRNTDGYIVSVKDRTDEVKDQIALKAAMSNLDLVANRHFLE